MSNYSLSLPIGFGTSVPSSLRLEEAALGGQISLAYTRPQTGPIDDTEFVYGLDEMLVNYQISLDDFIGLLDGDRSEFSVRVLAFAEIYGPLKICEWEFKRSTENIGAHETCSEPLDDWWTLANIVRSVLALAVSSRQELPGQQEDWVQLELGTRFTGGGMGFVEAGFDYNAWKSTPAGQLPTDMAKSMVGYERTRLGIVLGDLMRLTKIDVEPMWEFDEPAPRLHILPNGLLGGIVIKVLDAILSDHGVYACSGCGHPFGVPKGRRKPARGKKIWCPACGPMEMQRQWQKNHYSEQKEKERSEINA